MLPSRSFFFTKEPTDSGLSPLTVTNPVDGAFTTISPGDVLPASQPVAGIACGMLIAAAFAVANPMAA